MSPKSLKSPGGGRSDHTRELQLANDALEKMNRELASFAYASSHDLQEPLRKIQIFASFLQQSENERLSDKGKDYLRRMKIAAAHMQQLIQDILAYSLNSNKTAPFESTDLNKVLERVLEELKETITTQKAIIDTTSLPQLNGIPFQLQQLFTNLLSNSLKFSKPGLAPHIVLRAGIAPGETIGDKAAVAGKPYHHISISDNGIGFLPEYSTCIFDAFQRLHGHTEYEGTGIGLAICKRIVENHGGFLLASGEPENGAVFRIYLPA